MPKFICPITRCLHHNGHDCEYEMITVSPKSDDLNMTIACHHQELVGNCNLFGKKIPHSSSVCNECLTNIL